MDFTEIAIRIIESIKGLTPMGVLALFILCATACFLAWLRMTHSVAWLQASPEQIQARALFAGKPLKVTALPPPPRDPPSPIVPIVIMVLLAACMLWPRSGLGLAARHHRGNLVGSENMSAQTLPIGDFNPDRRPVGIQGNR